MTSNEKRKVDPNNVTINFTLRLDDPNPRIRKIANILREGRAIDKHGLFITKGKDLCLYAIELFDHLGSQSDQPEQPEFFPKVVPKISPSDLNVAKPEEDKNVKDALAGMGLDDFVNA